MTDPRPPFTETYVRAVVAGLGLEVPRPPRSIHMIDGHSNDLAAACFDSGRVLMIKRARDWTAAARVRTSQMAARLVYEQTDLLVPFPLAVSETLAAELILAYWRLPAPTLDALWPGLGPESQAAALRQWGRLMRRIHDVRLAGHGPLMEAEHKHGTPAAFLAEDLIGRLRPAIGHDWPQVVSLVDCLLARISNLSGRDDDVPAVVVHNDLFAANVLCRQENIHCVGVIDFEDAFAGPPEADLAKVEILHGPLFGRRLADGAVEQILEGYGTMPDRTLMALFRAYHLLNMGYHAVLRGMMGHAADVALAVRWEIAAAETQRSHIDVLRQAEGLSL